MEKERLYFQKRCYVILLVQNAVEMERYRLHRYGAGVRIWYIN